MGKLIEISIQFEAEQRKALTAFSSAYRFTPDELNQITGVLGRIVQVVSDYELFGLAGSDVEVERGKKIKVTTAAGEQIPTPAARDIKRPAAPERWEQNGPDDKRDFVKVKQ
jgi:hypothetical protein